MTDLAGPQAEQDGQLGHPVTAAGHREPRSRRRRLVSVLASVGIVVGVFWFFLPQLADISTVWASIRAMTWLEISILLAAALWNLASYGLVLVPTLPGLRLSQALVVTESSTAVSNTIPGGGALGIGLTYAMYASWGFSQSRSTVSVLLSGIWNNFVKLGLPVLALALLALHGSPTLARLVAGLVGVAGLAGTVALAALTLRSPTMAARTARASARVAAPLLRLIRKPAPTGWESAITAFRTQTLLLLRTRWRGLTAATLVNHLSLFVLLLLCLRYVGVPAGDVGWIEALAVFAFARLVTAIPITPGGVGIVEIALIAGLTAAGGAAAPVAAGVLVYRALSYVLPVPLGIATYVYWQRSTRWRRPPTARGISPP